MGPTYISQLSAMLKRNFLFKKRQKKVTFLEIFLPLYILSCLATFKVLFQNPRFDTKNQAIVNLSLAESFQKDKNLTVAVVPDTPSIRKFMNKLNNLWVSKSGDLLRFVFYEDELILENAYWKDDLYFGMAIIFHSRNPIEDSLNYKIRINPNYASIPSTTIIYSPPMTCNIQPNSETSNVAAENCPAHQYYHSGFVLMQSLIDYTYIKIKTADENRDFITLPSIKLGLMPKSTGTEDSSFRLAITISLVLALSQMISSLLALIVGEKEKKIKEGMKIMGLKDSVYWLSWFIVYSIYVIIISTVAIILLYKLNVFKHTNHYLILLLLLLFGFSIILMAFMMTPFFDKSRRAGILGNFTISLLSLLYFISYVVDDDHAYILWMISLINSPGFAMAFNKALVLDLSGEGVTLTNMWSGPGMSFGDSLVMMTVDIVLYAFLAYYLDSVIPSEYGSKQPPWFFFTADFWGLNKKKVKTFSEEGTNQLESSDIEPMPNEMEGKEVMKIRNLFKTFQSCWKSEVKAIDGFNLNIYEGQITAILGHNGAGKTTLINLLTGLTSPTSGMITIYGYDIRKPGSFSNIHQMIGLCPQHDILFDVLSSYEHLEFFARIRGVPSRSLEEVIIRTLKDIDLEESAHVFSKYLSGGQRRKLSVGIAIIGDPKIIILDEPTAGVDIVSKRHLWTVLQNKKHGKVILLSTHFMDEADILADRKAVISKGRVRCCGTSLFLKNKFGVGYHLTLVMRDTLPDKTSDIVNLVCEFVPKAKYSRKIAHDLSFILPLNSVDNFPFLFTTIEEEIKTQSRGLNIISYGVSMTTLGEVFFGLEKNEEELSEVNDFPQTTEKHSKYLPLILESNYDDQRKTMQDFQNGDHEDSEIIVDDRVEPRSDNKDNIIKKPFYIFLAMLKLRMLCLMRDFKTIINIIIISLIFCFIGIIFMGHEMTAPSIKPLPLNIGTFEIAIAMHNETSHSVARFTSHISNDMKVEWYNGSFASLLNKSSLNLIAAINITNCCHPSNLSFSIVYNDTQIHSLPTVINTINNAVYRMMLENVSMTQNRTITLSTYPFQKISSSGNFNYLAFTGSFWLGMGLVIASATIVIDAIIDRETKSKNQLRVNGLSFLGYYGPYILIFTGIMIILCFGLLCLLYLLKFECLKETSALIPFLGTVFLFCISSVTFTTCLSFVFNKAETAQTHMANMIIFLGLIPFAITTALYSVNSDSMAPYIAHLIFSVLNPMYVPYSLFYFIFKVPSACHLNLALSCSAQYLNKEVITLMVGTLLQIPIYLSFLFFLDFGKAGGSFTDFVRKIFRIKPKMKRKTSVSSNEIPSENCDLKAEQEKVDNFMLGSIPPSSNYPVIVVQNLKKEYLAKGKSSKSCKKTSKVKVGPKVAVKNLSFVVESGDIFGLLGHNGAGKSTAIRLITAEETPTKGSINIRGQNILPGISDVFGLIGYCPQYDAQWKTITIREHLELYSVIRGIPSHKIKRTIDSLLTGLQLEEYANAQTQHCSGGTKRKLSFAISMIGNPCVVLMDEPTTGIDHYSRRFIWDKIITTFQGKQGAILTTHSMDEADTLCTKVGIMVQGELRCIGSTQHLKNQYGAGYTLEIKLNHSDTSTSLLERHNALKLFVDQLFPEASVESDFIGRIVYNVPQESVTSLSMCFSQLEKAKENFKIEEYSFSQTTLEQVFLNFAIYESEL